MEYSHVQGPYTVVKNSSHVQGPYLTPLPVFSPGGGAIEMELSKYLRDYSRTVAGKEQLIIASVAKSLEVIPRQLCDNAGFDSTNVLNRLRQAHGKGSLSIIIILVQRCVVPWHSTDTRVIYIDYCTNSFFFQSVVIIGVSLSEPHTGRLLVWLVRTSFRNISYKCTCSQRNCLDFTFTNATWLIIPQLNTRP